MQELYQAPEAKLEVALPFSLLRVTGADAASFLQGQVTTNVLDMKKAEYSCRCQQNGRVLASFILAKQSNDFLVLLPKGMPERLLKGFKTYSRFSKVSFAVEERNLIGRWSKTAWEEQHSEFSIPWPTLHGHRTISWDPSLASIPFRNEPWEEWKAHDILAKIAWIVPETSEQFTPLSLNFYETGVIDLKKGCYLGQEIIARMYYRGHQKSGLRALTLRTKQIEAICPGTALFFSGQEAIAAEVVACAPLRAEHAIALITSKQGLETGTLLLKSGEAVEVESIPPREK